MSSKYRIVTIFILIGLLLAVSTNAQAQPNFQYLTEFEARSPMALAADANGGLYYTSFTFAGPNLSKVYYIADPLKANALDNHRAIIDDDPSPAGRGWHGVAVDDKGAVYAVLETGTGSSCEVRKLTPAPNFAPDPNFGGGILMDGQRHNGVAWMGRDAQGIGYIAITTFGNCEIWDADLGGAFKTAANGESYQRDCAFNPKTGEIYISTNRDRSGEGLPQRSVNIWRGGSVDNIDAYEDSIVSGFITEGASSTQYGVNGQQIGFDVQSGLIMIAFRDGKNEALNNTVGFYDPANPTAAVLRLNASESPNGPFVSPADMVTVQTNSGTLLYVSDVDANRIVVFTTGQTAVSEFMLY